MNAQDVYTTVVLKSIHYMCKACSVEDKPRVLHITNLSRVYIQIIMVKLSLLTFTTINAQSVYILSLIGIFVEHPLHRATGHVFVKPDLMHAQGYTGMKRSRP